MNEAFLLMKSNDFIWSTTTVPETFFNSLGRVKCDFIFGAEEVIGHIRTRLSFRLSSFLDKTRQGLLLAISDPV